MVMMVRMMMMIMKTIMIKISDKRNLCGDMGGTRGSAGESRGETLRGPDTSRDQQLHHIDEEGDQRVKYL